MPIYLLLEEISGYKYYSLGLLYDKNFRFVTTFICIIFAAIKLRKIIKKIMLWIIQIL